jgi:hypothetical protein
MIVRSSFRNSSSETVRASRRAREHARPCLLILDRTRFPEQDRFHYRIQWSILRYDEAPAIAPVGALGPRRRSSPFRDFLPIRSGDRSSEGMRLWRD